MSTELSSIAASSPPQSHAQANEHDAKPPRDPRAEARDPQAEKREPGGVQYSNKSPNDASLDVVRERAEELFDHLTKGVLRTNARLSLDRDEATDTPVFKVIDASTGDVIRQWPMEEALELARRLQEDGEGLVVDQRV